jgi:stage II sporulation protein Q
MKYRKLRSWVVPTVCLFLIGVIFYSGYQIWQIMESDQNISTDDTYVTSPIITQDIPTIATKDVIIRPYNDPSVEATIPFYNVNGTDAEQQAAIIYYENIYMENTGVMYSSNNNFDALSVLDGTVKDIKDDAIMGKIVEVENSKTITTIYQSLATVNVSVGQSLKQGDIIGSAGQNNIVGDNRQCLHFEVFKKGEIIDPEQFYLMSTDELND